MNTGLGNCRTVENRVLKCISIAINSIILQCNKIEPCAMQKFTTHYIIGAHTPEIIQIIRRVRHLD